MRAAVPAHGGRIRFRRAADASENGSHLLVRASHGSPGLPGQRLELVADAPGRSRPRRTGSRAPLPAGIRPGGRADRSAAAAPPGSPGREVASTGSRASRRTPGARPPEILRRGERVGGGGSPSRNGRMRVTGRGRPWLLSRFEYWSRLPRGRKTPLDYHVRKRRTATRRAWSTLTAMELNAAICDRARMARDARFDGRFFIAILSTGIYCRPICPSPHARRENVRYFRSANEAVAAGFRACRRCRPEAAPGTPRWNGTASTVSRALRLIEDGALRERRPLGPVAPAGSQRAPAPPPLLDPPRHLSHRRREDVAAGLREAAPPRHRSPDGPGRDRGRVSDRSPLQRRDPRALRPDAFGAPTAAGRASTRSARAIVVRLSYRAPYDWDSLLEFLAERAIPGVEEAASGVLPADVLRTTAASGFWRCATTAPGGARGAGARHRSRVAPADPGARPRHVRSRRGHDRHRKHLGSDPFLHRSSGDIRGFACRARGIPSRWR